MSNEIFIDGDVDAIQLRVQGHTTQTNPLQTWEGSDGAPLGQISGDGRLELGNLDMGTPDALVEANRDITLPSSVPQRGVQSQGRVTGNGANVIDGAIAWAVHELELLGDAVVSGIHAALRGKVTRKNTSASPQAELRAADFEAINDTTSGANSVGKLVGVQSAVTNEQGAHLADAIGVAVKISDDNTPGQITNAYGLRIDPIPAGSGATYAIHTGEGSVHVGDDLEVKVFAAPPVENPPSGFIKMYPKLNAGIPTLYAKDSDGIERTLGGGGGGGSGGNNVAVTKKAVQTRTVLYDHTLVSAGNFDVTNISQDYDRLEIMLAARHASDDQYWADMPLNGDTTAGNYLQAYYYYGTADQSAAVTGYGLGYITGNNSPANEYGYIHAVLDDYALTDRHKTVTSESFSTRASGRYGEIVHWQWQNTAAVTRIQVQGSTGNFAAGSRLQIVGIKEEEVVTNVTGGGEGAVVVAKKAIRTETVIADTTLTSPGTFDFNNISQEYDHLRIIAVAQSDGNAEDNILLAFNGDTTATNYKSSIHLFGSVHEDYLMDSRIVANLPSNANSSLFTSVIMDILDYTNTSRQKQVLSRGHSAHTDHYYAHQENLQWENNAAVTRITLTGDVSTNLKAGTHVILIGIKEEQVVTDVTGGSGSSVVTKKTVQTRTVLYDETLVANGTFDAQNISQDYDHLEIILKGRTTSALTNEGARLALNADATDANYFRASLWSTDGTHNSAEYADRYFGTMPAANSPANTFGWIQVRIDNYTGSQQKDASLLNSTLYESDKATIHFGNLHWLNTAAISRIQLDGYSGGSFVAGSRLQIVGIKEEELVSDVTGGGGSPVVTKKTVQTRTVLYDETLASAGTLDVQNISQDYDHLELVLVSRAVSTSDPNSTGVLNVYCNFNNDTTDTNYGLIQTASSNGAGESHNLFDGQRSNLATVNGNAVANRFALARAFIPWYAGDKHKLAQAHIQGINSNTLGQALYREFVWKSTAAINQITLAVHDATNTFATGTRLQVIGIKEEEVVTNVTGGGAPTTAKYLTASSEEMLSNEIVIPGLAGSADIAGVGSGGIDEEFDTPTTGLTWTPSTPNTVDSNTTRPSHLYIKSTDATERFGLRPWTPAGAFDARAKIALSDPDGNGGATGLMIANAANTLRVALTMASDNTNKRVNLTAYTYASPTWTSRGTWIIYQQEAYLRITRDASNNISWFISLDGWAWQRIVTFAFAFTPSQIGFRSSGATNEVYVDFLRTNV